jgi:hypothetical protein
MDTYKQYLKSHLNEGFGLYKHVNFETNCFGTLDFWVFEIPSHKGKSLLQYSSAKYYSTTKIEVGIVTNFRGNKTIDPDKTLERRILFTCKM